RRAGDGYISIVTDKTVAVDVQIASHGQSVESSCTIVCCCQVAADVSTDGQTVHIIERHVMSAADSDRTAEIIRVVQREVIASTCRQRCRSTYDHVSIVANQTVGLRIQIRSNIQGIERGSSVGERRQAAANVSADGQTVDIE